MRVVIAAAFLQLLSSVAGEPPGIGQCLILHNGSVVIHGLIPVNASYTCTATFPDNPTQASVELHVIALSRQPPRAASPGPPGEDASLARRCEVFENGSLSLRGVFLDGVGSYNCSTASQDNRTTIQTVSLQVLGNEEVLSTSIAPTTLLPNGTRVVYRGQTVAFNCSGSAEPASRTLSWGFWGAGTHNASLVATGGGVGEAWLGLSIAAIQPDAQGEYWCESRSTVSPRRTNSSTQLLVYYAPAQHPDCMWTLGPDPSQAEFDCSWPGAYPPPTLRWVGIKAGPDPRARDRRYEAGQADRLVLTLNRSELFDGQLLKCIAEHPALLPEEHKSCLLDLKLPFPEGSPLVTALEQTNVTLTCSETTSTPPAKTTWRRGAEQAEIQTGSRYLVTEAGPDLHLTIHNVSREDEGTYFCRSENPLAVRELEVYLTVKASVAYSGALIGLFIAALTVGVGLIVARLLYTSRDRICLGTGFGRMEEDQGDVISLVDSEEEVFQEAVPYLPPVSVDHHTTLVEIHPVPVGEAEDVVSPEASDERKENIAEFEDPLQLIKF